MRYGLYALLIGVLVSVFLIGIPVAAHHDCPPSCPPGEVWEIVVPAHYDCHTGENYRSCDGANHEQHYTPDEYGWGPCHSGTPDPVHSHDGCSSGKHRDWVIVDHGHWGPCVSCPYDSAEYGCVAVSCPAIPCDEGFLCESGECVDHRCDKVECQYGEVCSAGECGPIPCEGNNDCPGGFACRDGFCERLSGGFAPFTTDECQQFVMNSRPLDDVDASTLEVLPLKNTLVRFTAIIPQGTYDCVGIAWYGNGEVSYSGIKPHVEYYNFQQLKTAMSGSYCVVDAKLPTQVVRLIAIKDEMTDDSIVGHLSVTDSHGKVGLDVYTADDYDKMFALPPDFQGWRPSEGILTTIIP
jgi:hypothetical protein